MKGFIEVTLLNDGRKTLINVGHIESVLSLDHSTTGFIWYANQGYTKTAESYDEIKRMIEEAL